MRKRSVQKKSPINGVIDRYARKLKQTKLTVRKLDKQTVLLEGSSTALKFLADLLTALTVEADCGFHISPKNAGNAWFAKDANLGLYLHRLPCVGTNPPHGRGTYKRPLRGKRVRLPR